MAQLIDSFVNTKTEIDGKWVIAKPLEFYGLYRYWMRLKDAWLVLQGKAIAVTFYKQ